MHLDSPKLGGTNLCFQGNILMWGQQTQKKKRQAIVYGAPIFQLSLGLFLFTAYKSDPTNFHTPNSQRVH
jgi:hypothetical protein